MPREFTRQRYRPPAAGCVCYDIEGLMYFVRAMATVYFAKWVLLSNGEILENGAVKVEDNRITAVGPRGKLRRSSRDRIVNLSETLLIPGLINMHTHLEEGVLRGMHKGEDESFASWIARRRSNVAHAPPDALISTIRLGIREALANGITTLVDTSATDISALVLRDEPIRSWMIHEVHPDDDRGEEKIVATLRKRIDRSRREKNIGVGPYALFSLSPGRHKALIEMARDEGYLWASHMAESSEELQAFSEQTGELHANITRTRRWPYGKTERGSMYYAVTNNLIPNHGICYHCNYMSGQELSLLAAKSVSAVFCCHYNSVLGHKPFPLDVALNRGMNVCLGTESPESSGPMNLFDELYLLKTTYPHVPAARLISLATSNAAKALRCNELGTLEPGKLADIVGLRFPHDPREDVLEEMVVEELRVVLVIVDGEEVIVGY
jgi:5-methylthioadenosine/S-adenosylhomocysteine deaminase